MKDDNRKCWNCGSFRAYYTRGYCCLLKENNGFCNRNNKIMEKSDSCEKWFSRHTSKEKRTRIAVNSISEIYQKVAVLEQLLMDELEVEKLKNDSIDE